MSLAGLGEPLTALRLQAAARAEWTRHGLNMQVRFRDALMERYITRLVPR